jgi:hypothetical protein
MAGPAGLLAVALFIASGAGLTEFSPALRRLPLPRRLAYAYLLGVAWIAGGLYAGSHLWEMPLRVPWVLALAALPMAAAVAVRLRESKRQVGEKGPRSERPLLSGAQVAGWTLAAGALAAIVTVAVFADAATRPLTDWDGRMTWATQAKYLRAEGTVHPSALVNAKWFVAHPRYPLLLPVTQVAVQEIARAGEDEQPFRLAYAAFFPVALLLLWDGAVRRAGRRAAAVAVLAIAPLPLLAFFGEGSATGAYSDLPLACFYGAGLLLLFRPGLRPMDGIAAGLLLGAAVLTKNEGALLAPFGLLFAAWPRAKWALLRRRRPPLRLVLRRLGPLAVAAVCGLAPLLLLRSWRAGIPNRHDESYLELLTPARLASGLPRLPEVVPLLLERTFLSAEWLLFWWVAAAALLAAGSGPFRKPGIFLLAGAAPLAVGLLAYAVHWDPLYLAGVTWSRLLLQGLVPWGVVLAGALRRLIAAA